MIGAIAIAARNVVVHKIKVVAPLTETVSLLSVEAAGIAAVSSTELNIGVLRATSRSLTRCFSLDNRYVGNYKASDLMGRTHPLLSENFSKGILVTSIKALQLLDRHVQEQSKEPMSFPVGINDQPG